MKITPQSSKSHVLNLKRKNILNFQKNNFPKQSSLSKKSPKFLRHYLIKGLRRLKQSYCFH